MRAYSLGNYKDQIHLPAPAGAGIDFGGGCSEVVERRSLMGLSLKRQLLQTGTDCSVDSSAGAGDEGSGL